LSNVSPLLEDRPLHRSAGDLLGFDPIAEGLADQLQVTSAGGLLSAVTARTAGGGRTSFLNLLHAALLQRGVGVLRLGGGDDLRALLERARAPAGLPAPVALVDDADLDDVAHLDDSSGSAAVVAAFRPDADPAEEQARRSASPLLVELPAWDARAAEALLDARLGGAALEPGERELWIALLATACSPRRAVRLANAAMAVAAATRRERRVVLAAVATALGLDGLPGLTVSGLLPAGRGEELVGLASRFCGAVGLPGGDAGRSLAESDEAARRIFGTAPPIPPELEPESQATGGPATGEADEDGPEDEEEPQLSGVERRRRRCVELGGRGGPASTEELLRLLADDHPSVRLSASHALASLADPSAAPELRRLLSSSDASLRRTAAFVLGRLGDEASRDDLVRLLVDVNPSVRRAAAAALGRVGGEGVLRPLLLALDDAHAAVRMATETALSRTLGTLPEGRLDGLLEAGDERGRRAALRAAGRLGFGRREVLERVLAEPGPLALEAAEALGRRRESESLPALAEAAASNRGDLRSAALAAIGRITDGSAAGGLAGLLTHPDASVRERAKKALGRCPGAYEAVLPFLGDADDDLRSTAADALGRCGDRRAIGPLLEAHDRGGPELRRAAAASLVRLGFEP
jgi:HEAT repeat protein